MNHALTVERSLEKIEQHRDLLVSGEGKIAPGQPLTFSPASTIGDRIWQGDLGLTIRDEKVPENYKLRETPDGQLVPGNTTGAKHIVRDVAGVQIYDPPGWSPTYDELRGPILRALRDTTIDHPTHGSVTILEGQCVECGYQRVWDQEQAKERRQRD